MTEVPNLLSGWRSTIRGYEILVLDRGDDHPPARALLRSGKAQLVARRGPVVVLRQRH